MRILLTFLCCVLALGAQAQTSHWSVNIYDYQYDMTAYVSLTVDEAPVTDYSDYEIAAFCGNECRGVATIETATKGSQQISYGHLRIYSNKTSGESITFRVYRKSTKRVLAVSGDGVTFKNLDIKGLPSNPLQLVTTMVIPGDANGDGKVSIADAVAIIDYILSDGTTPIEPSAADMSGDGKVSIADAVAIVDYILNN